MSLRIPILRTSSVLAPGSLPTVYNSVSGNIEPATATILFAIISVMAGIIFAVTMNAEDRRFQQRKKRELEIEWSQAAWTKKPIQGYKVEHDFVEDKMKDKNYVPKNYICPICDTHYDWTVRRCKNRECRKMPISQNRVFVDNTLGWR